MSKKPTLDFYSAPLLTAPQLQPTTQQCLGVAVRPTRMEERGRIENLLPTSFCILFERAPVWLLSLSALNASNIHSADIQSFEHFNSHLHENKINKCFYQSILSYIGLEKLYLDLHL